MDKENLQKLWKSIKGELEITVNSTYFKTHIPGTFIKNINEQDKLIEFSCPSDFQRNFIENRIYGHIKQVVSKLLGSDYKLMFSVTKKELTKIPQDDLGPLFKQTKEINTQTAIQSAGLNGQYTFERLIVGNNNRLAYAVSTAIADNPGKVYNPLFLYSGVGLGKTHLVQSIGHQILKNHPNLKVLYITGEQFLNEVVESLRSGKGGRKKITDLKRTYRNLDVLIIDDVHAIAGKDATQEEFFHTFNTLFMAQKQIILTSDRAPHEINTLEKRLSSRFASGMIADMQPPDVETRLAILKDRNEEMNLNTPKDVLQYIATLVDTNIRELEAKLLQIATRAKGEGKDLTLDLCKSIDTQIEKNKKTRITPTLIIREVAKYYGITIRDVKGKRRVKNFVTPRQIIMFLLRDIIDLGYQPIGELLGNRDHTTVMHGVDKIRALIQDNNKLSQEINQIKTNISAVSIA